jgi:excisionase family DNA binding protein
MIPELYTKEEAAKLLRISEKTLDKLVARGEINSTKIGRRRIFTESHIKQYIENNEVKN